MKIVEKYILRQLIVGFILILTSLTILVWLTQSLKMIDMIVTKGVSVSIFFEMTLLVLPNFLQILMPLALFAVALFTFIRMQSDKELMVLKAVGMSAKQLMRPVFLMASVLTVIGYCLSLWITPIAVSQMREIKWKIQNNLSQLLLQEGQFNSFKKGTMLYVKERAEDGSYKGVLAFEIKNGKKTLLVANSGTVFQTPEGLDIIFGEGSRQEFDAKTGQFSVLKFDKYTMSFSDNNRKAGTRIKDVREMDLKYLLQATQKEVGHAPLWRKYKVEAFKRLTMPLYNFVFAFLALSAVLLGTYNRNGNSKRVNMVVFFALLIQTSELAFDNAATKNLWCLILAGLNIALPLLIIKSLFSREQKISLRKKLVLILGILLVGNSAFAMVKVDTSGLKKDQPVDFEADSVHYNQKTQKMTANGNVVLTQKGSVLKTEEIVYDKAQDIVHVPEIAHITLADGTKVEVTNTHIFPKNSEMITGPAEAELIDGTRISAEKIIRKELGNETLFKKAHYTPCDFCETSAPWWRLTATTLEQDDPNKTLRFWNMLFEVKKVPVAYFPYFQMPDLSVKRKTGFLIPSFGSYSVMKSALRLPFFVNVADNQNLTLTPIFSLVHDPMGLVDYQGRFSQGTINFNSSLTQDEDDKNQGHIKANFVYEPSENWRFHGQYFRTTSDTYFRRYRMTEMDNTVSFLTSSLGGEYFGTRMQGSAEVLSFQSLRDKVRSESIPILLPVMHLNYQTRPLNDLGLYAFTEADSALINNREHFKSNRLSLKQGVKLPYITSFGLSTQTEVSVRGDAYSIDTGNYNIANRPQNDTYFAGRVFPEAVLTMSYPLVQNNSTFSQVIEPIVQVVASPNGANDEKIPNEDSAVFDFSDVNLFLTNRFSGYDRIESGSRVNYGVQWSLYQNQKNQSLQVLLGQTVRLREKGELTDAMGYHEHLSNYVGRIRLNHELFRLSYRFRFDQRSLEARKNDIEFETGPKALRVGVDYLFQDSYKLGTANYAQRKEVTVYGRAKLSRNFSARAEYRYDLRKQNKGPLESSMILRYDNECTAIEAGISKSFTKDRNYRGDTSFNIRLYLKTLGGTQ